MADDSKGRLATEGHTPPSVAPASPDTAKEAPQDTPKCPQCDGKTARYDGPNPHKAGSAECPRCQLRVR